MQPPKSIAHFEISGEIGAGGMGVVYRARDTRLDRTVAVKVLASDKLDAADHQGRFIREAKTASSLNHPNIVTIYDVLRVDEMHVIVMEYIEGRPLTKTIPAGGLPVREGIRYAIQIADGMEKAHSAGIVHRDLKPANIMITPDGLVKILDFGLAKKWIGPDDLTLAQSVTVSGAVLGTVAYMSPEQAMGRTIDARSDIFSFGIVLYEMFAGARPFAANTAFAVLKKIHDDKQGPLKYIRPDVPDAIHAIVDKALEKRPEQRFQTMAELKASLTAALEELTMSSLTRHHPRRFGGWKQYRSAAFRYKWLGAALAAAILVVLQAGNIARWLTPEPARPQVADVSALPVTAMTAVEWLRAGGDYLGRYELPGNIDRAITSFKKAIEQDPNYAAAHAGLAEGYLRKNAGAPDVQWTRLATDSVNRALELNSDLAVAHLARGLLLTQMKDVDAGAREYERALQLDPQNALALQRLGNHYFERGDHGKAEKFYADAVAREPNNWLMHSDQARFYFRTDKYQDAANGWEKALTLAPDNVIVYRNLGGAYHMLDRYDDAARALQRAIELQPSSASAGAYTNLGTVRFYQGNYVEAVRAFERAVQLNPTWYLYWGNLGDAHRWISGHEKQALDAYIRAIELTKERLQTAREDPDLIGSLAVYYAKTGSKRECLDTLKRLETFPKLTGGIRFKALIAYELCGEREQALKSLAAALKSGYPAKEFRIEPELTKLRSDRRYHEILVAASKS